MLLPPIAAPSPPLGWIGLAAATAFAFAAAPAPPARADGCADAGCAPGSFHSVTFESLAPGDSVEGLGRLDPDLAITSVASSQWPPCTAGSALVIEERNNVPYASYDANSGFVNDCLTGTKGMGDDNNCVLDYAFTFAPGVTVSCFSIRILDFGDYFPYGGTSHRVALRAFNAANFLLDLDDLIVTGGTTTAGDACDAGPGDPGNAVLMVAGPGIARVTLTFETFPDPNVGFDDLSFCEEDGGTPVRAATWGAFKHLYR